MPLNRAKAAKLDQRSKYLRRRIIETLDATRRGHVGAALSLVEILRVLYDDVLRYDAHNPKWDQRDRCILSKGHGCLALYVVLQDKGFFPEEELWKLFPETDDVSEVQIVSSSAKPNPPRTKSGDNPLAFVLIPLFAFPFAAAFAF